ncbi:RDD family protein [Streptomyces dangxiongensis]|uniref:RDD family protein n=1 Tax=Streptomyces dangxiongensis TaxID=1442032 RepID=A0A3G2JFF8_9ACTN|nr:RDD family protein [Streptomyces dangxiongensis]AYN41083.1 RDD family protein [Streptomyces dangxiongensis]
MSAPTPAAGDDRPREGYYPDPSIPGYVRYWNGSSWVPGTSRPAPKDGEPLIPPAGIRPAAPSVEETGPHFFDEDPADPVRQPHTARTDPADQWPRTDPAEHTAHAGQAAEDGQDAQGAQWDHRTHPGLPGLQGEAGRVEGWGADPRVPAGAAGGRVAARTEGAAATPPAEDEAPDPGTFLFRRPIPGPAAHSDDGTMTFRPVPAGAEGDPPGGPGPAGFGTQGPVGATTPTTPASSAAAGNHGFGAGKAAAARATAAPSPETPGTTQAPWTPGTPQTPQGVQPGPAAAGFPTASGVPASPAGVTPSVPQQSAAPTTPLTSGSGGGQSSWAQQVHQLAGGGDEQPPAPWKPPVEDVFQAAARRQAAARPAGLGKRFAARLIDLLVVGAVTAAAAVPLGLRAADHVQEKIDAARLSGRTVTVWLLDGTTGTSLGIVLAVLLLAGVLYEVLPTAKWGRTLGKKLCGLQVRDIEGHEPPAFGPALRRWLVFSVPGLLVVGVVGMLWCLFDRPWHQCWHDKAAHTFVAG